MIQKTLLEIVQSTLGSMDSDLVSTFGETVESEQIAITAQEQFLELATYQRIPQFEKLTQLVGLSDNTKATVMSIPVGATDVKDIRYKTTSSNGKVQYREINYLPKEEFLSRALDLYVSDSNVAENVLPDGVRIPYRNDKGPEFWTTFDDETLVFDSIDTVIQGDTTLHENNSLVLAYIIPDFTMDDSFIPDVPLKMYPQYMNMIKELNSYEQRQISNEVRTRKSERQGNRNRWFGSVADGNDEGTGSKSGARMGRHTSRNWTNGQGRFR